MRPRFRPRTPFKKRNFSRKPKKFDESLLVQKAEIVEPAQAYVPQHSFEDFNISSSLKQVIRNYGYTTPTPIQDQAIPPILDGRDVVGVANTGTGKTAAFLIPLIDKLALNRSQKALIVAPTRELAVQIQQEFVAMSRNIYSVLCIGGVGINQQKTGLQRGASVVIGTPGRLKDLYNQKALNFSLYQTIILDEVDRMLDMGFINDVKFVIAKLPQIRQSLFFSATLSPSIMEIIQSFTNNPITVSVKTRETATNVDQDIIRTNGKLKLDVLGDLLSSEEFSKVLVFGRTKWGIRKLAVQLSERGFRVAEIHGNKSQGQRQRALDEFKRNRVNILLATDIASRGLDIADVSHVINYDLPGSYEDYVHRIGRTGRADKKGKALSFVD